MLPEGLLSRDRVLVTQKRGNGVQQHKDSISRTGWASCKTCFNFAGLQVLPLVAALSTHPHFNKETAGNVFVFLTGKSPHLPQITARVAQKKEGKKKDYRMNLKTKTLLHINVICD